MIQTLSELVAINSVNASYPGGVTEEAVAQYVERFFAHRGIETWRQDVMPGRNNVIARLPGRDPSRRIVLEAHMDTVSTSGMTIAPHVPEIRDGRLYGRGSCDTKAGLAAMMHALASLKEQSITPPCEVWLAAVVDEEFSFRGVAKLCEELRANAAIVAEPTQLRAVVASKGVLRWKIRTVGKASHSSKPQLGVNAIQDMAQVLLWLQREADLLARRTHPLLGPGTLSVGLIRGGEQVNLVPDACEISIDRRLLPVEDPLQVWTAYQERLAMIPNIEAHMDEPMLVDFPLETDSNERVVRVAQDVLKGLGLDAEIAGVPFGSDASKLSRLGIPTIIFGPGSIDRAHTADEYVECDQVLSALSFYIDFLGRFE
ncbi:MAG: M20 family metallopeptidase [Bryobacteraceae bacterium]